MKSLTGSMCMRCVALLVCGGSLSLSAQQHWAMGIGGLGNEHMADVAVDGVENIFVVGDFTASMLVDDVFHSSLGGSDVFVARSDAQGNLQWLVTGGGEAVDRGVGIVICPDGHVAVTGHFMGAADLFGEVVLSQGDSPDLFLAKLDGATGTLLWLRTGGGDYGADRPQDLVATPDGRITVTGSFQGEVQFGDEELVSLPDPLTELPSEDVFVASYSSVGELLWIKQGAGSYTDRGVAIAADASGNVFVTGQFSDTLTFDVMHPHSTFNASFLVKFGPTGEELWFRSFGGAQFSHVRGIASDAQEGVVLTGDLRGTMTWWNGGVSIPAPASYAVYVMHVDGAGNLLAHATSGSGSTLTASAVAVQGDSVAVLGSFTCQYTGLSDVLGTGLYIATGNSDLFVLRMALPGLAFSSAQQFGGRGPKQGGGITFAPDGGLLFCGSFNRQIIFPADGTNWPGTLSAQAPAQGLDGYCGDPWYGQYRRVEGAGAMDAFVARGFVEGRSPYDFWRREPGGECDRSSLPICIKRFDLLECLDSTVICLPPPPGNPPPFVDLLFDAPWVMQGEGGGPAVGPELALSWSTGSTASFVYPTVPGWLSVTGTLPGGCPFFTDATYIEIGENPVVRLSDSEGYNVDVPQPNSTAVPFCGPFTIWASTNENVESFQWTHDGVPLPGAEILVEAPGLYRYFAWSPSGCMTINSIEVLPAEVVPMPAFSGLDAQLLLQGQPLSSDTIIACEFDCVQGTVQLQWSVAGVPADPVPEVGQIVVIQPACSVEFTGGMVDSFAWSLVVPPGDGWFTVLMEVQLHNEPCGDDVLTFVHVDSVYISSVPLPVFLPPPDPQEICVDDTLHLFLSECQFCDQVDWTGPVVLGTYGSPDTALVGGIGSYGYSAIHEALGIACTTAGNLEVVAPPLVEVLTDPPGATVCPGDTVVLTAVTPGSGHVWEGPDGPLDDSEASISVTVPGNYTVTLVDAFGCQRFSAVVPVGHYGTPFLSIGDHSGILCPGETVLVQVVAPPEAEIQWAPPLTGNATFQWISEPGTYTAVIASCGNNYIRNITILGGSPEAALVDSGPFLLCPGDSVVLTAIGSPGDRYWLPDGVPGAQLVVTGPGTYQWMVTDDFGCEAVSEVAVVDVYDFAVPLVPFDTLACAGSYLTLSTPASGEVVWYAAFAPMDTVGVGPSLSVGPLADDLQFVVTQAEGPCTSEGVSFTVGMLPQPAAPDPGMPPTICIGADLTLEVVGEWEEMHWAFPQGTHQGPVLELFATGPGDAGTYSVWAIEGGCSSDTTTFQLAVEPCPIEVPNVFSPNGDGVNDVIFLTARGTGILSFEVYNRWGQRVALLEGETVTWDGRNAFTGMPLPGGTYFLVLRLTKGDGMEEAQRGTVTLLR